MEVFQIFHMDAEQEGTEYFLFYNHVCSWIKAIFVDTNTEKCVNTFVEKTKESRRKRGNCCDIYRSATVNAVKTG